MPTRVRGVLYPLVAAFVLLPLMPGQASAIPAFARKYKITCAMCHAPFPRLNAFGEMFAANGFQMARGETPLDTLTTGDPLLRLQRDIPLAIRMEAYMSSLSGDDQVALDLKTPWGIKLLTGGQVTDNISYYMYFFLSERGEIAGLEDAYLQFNNVLGSPVDIIAGQFQVSDPLFKRELRLEYEDYMPYRVRVGEVGADLTYERGLMAITSPWKDADLFVQVVNGRGLAEATEQKNFDNNNNNKNVGVRFSQGLPVARVGAFYYGGLQKGNDLSSRMLVLAPDATVPFGPNVEMNLQYVYRRDDNPFFLDTCLQGDDRCSYGRDNPLRTEVNSYMAEMIYSPQGPMGRWHFTGLYNRVDADNPIFSLRVGEEGLLQNYESVGFSAHYLTARNFRFMAEVNQDLHLNRTRWTTGVVTAF